MPGGGYVMGFGEYEPESLEQQRARLQQRSGKVEDTRGDDDVGENDWSVSYADMVTLLMAFFVILTAVTVSKKPSEIDGITDRPVHMEQSPSSPFDGRGFTIAEFGVPANQDNVVSRFDDPEANGATTDPSPSGTAQTGSVTTPETSPPDAAVEPQPAAITETPEPIPPEPVVSETSPPIPPPAANPLAEQLQQMVQQSDLAGQVEVITGAQSVTVRISDRILFASGKALLEDGGKALVQRLSAILAQTASKGGIISIEGHTDNIPISTMQYPSNWELSSARAAMVVRELIERGLPRDRLRAIGYADTKPVASNRSRDGRSSNRRVELVITTDPTAAQQP
jgi:chemotaxis protein MotB